MTEFCFTKVDVSGLGPISENQPPLNFNTGLNIISGGNGTGKTFIAKKLLENVPKEVSAELIHIGENYYGHEKQLKELFIENYSNDLKIKYENALNKIFNLKYGKSKFVFEFEKDANNSIINSTYRDLGATNEYRLLHPATSERICMALAMKFSIAAITNLNAPLIIDGLLLELDTSLRTSFLDFAIANYSQIILLASPLALDLANLKPDYMLLFHRDNQHTYITTKYPIKS